MRAALKGQIWGVVKQCLETDQRKLNLPHLKL